MRQYDLWGALAYNIIFELPPRIAYKILQDRWLLQPKTASRRRSIRDLLVYEPLEPLGPVVGATRVTLPAANLGAPHYKACPGSTIRDDLLTRRPPRTTRATSTRTSRSSPPAARSTLPPSSSRPVRARRLGSLPSRAPSRRATFHPTSPPVVAPAPPAPRLAAMPQHVALAPPPQQPKRAKAEAPCGLWRANADGDRWPTPRSVAVSNGALLAHDTRRTAPSTAPPMRRPLPVLQVALGAAPMTTTLGQCESAKSALPPEHETSPTT